MVGLRPGAEWVILGKNGTDVTSAAKLAARAGTGKKLILREAANPKGHAAPHWAYHGAHSWMRGAAGKQHNLALLATPHLPPIYP